MGNTCTSSNKEDKKPKKTTITDLHKQLRRRREALQKTDQQEVDAYYEDYYRHDELLGHMHSSPQNNHQQLTEEEQKEWECAAAAVSPRGGGAGGAQEFCNCNHCGQLRGLRGGGAGDKGKPPLSPPSDDIHNSSMTPPASPDASQIETTKRHTSASVVGCEGFEGLETLHRGRIKGAEASHSTTHASSGNLTEDETKAEESHSTGSSAAADVALDGSCRRAQWAATRANTQAKLTRKRPPPLAMEVRL